MPTAIAETIKMESEDFEWLIEDQEYAGADQMQQTGIEKSHGRG